MKKLILAILPTMLLCACVSTQKTRDQASIDLETKKDPILTMETFNSAYGLDWYNSACQEDSDKKGVYYLNRDYKDTSYGYKKYTLYDMQRLTKAGVDLKCFFGWDGGNGWGSTLTFDDNTDECIMNRRSVKFSKICSFDYKRFLPEGTKFKTEDDFLRGAKFLTNGLKQCDELAESTTSEKEQCKENVKNNILRFSNGKKQVHCRDVLSLQVYNNALKEMRQNTIADANYLIGICRFKRESFCDEYKNWKPDFYKNIEDYGRDNLCSVIGYKDDLKRLGLN